MEKEIKYRGWNEKYKEFVTLKIDEHGPVVVAVNPLPPGGIKVWQEFIGHQDKNGKDIYEGDYITGNFETEFESYAPGEAEVIYCLPHAGFECKNIEAKIEDGGHWGIGENVKVIGNNCEGKIIKK